MKRLSKIDSIELSNFICLRIGKLSHLKLQKLLYYVQAFHLAYFEKKLIDDDFEAWLHGPVSKKVFIHFRHNEDFRLFDEFEVLDKFKKDVEEKIQKILTDDQFDLVEEVLESYGEKSGFELENLTHGEDPWINARRGVPVGAASSNIISSEEMKTYYKAQLYG